MSIVQYWGTGRRKTSVARVRIIPGGSGKVIINNKTVEEYFGRAALVVTLKQPLEIADKKSAFDVYANVKGGGTTGQAEAIRHGIARALVQADANLRPALRKSGFLTRDPRMTERKKYGQKGARARYQFSKR